MSINTNKLVAAIGWVFVLPGILSTMIFGFLSIFLSPRMLIPKTISPSGEITLGVLLILSIVIIVTLLVMTPIYILRKIVVKAQDPYRALWVLIAIIVANALLGSLVILAELEN